MILLISGATHTGKTLLAQKAVEALHSPCLSQDLLKMGLIRSGQTDLTPLDDEELTGYLWPITREMVRTAIENEQNLIVEGGYIPFTWERDFREEERRQIRFICLVMSPSYIQSHYPDIRRFADVMEKRGDEEGCTMEFLLRENAEVERKCIENGLEYVWIDGDYLAQTDIRKILKK